MKITNEQAEYLLSLPKKIVEGNQLLDRTINPEFILPHLPEKFHPFAGKDFTDKEHHIHYYVDGYKPLAWAIPIINDDFKIKEISEDVDFNSTFAEIIIQFAKTINIETAITINKQLL